MRGARGEQDVAVRDGREGGLRADWRRTLVSLLAPDEAHLLTASSDPQRTTRVFHPLTSWR